MTKALPTSSARQRLQAERHSSRGTPEVAEPVTVEWLEARLADPGKPIQTVPVAKT